MENFYFAVIPVPAYCLQGQAPAGIPWLQMLKDPRWSLSPQSLGGDGDDGLG